MLPSIAIRSLAVPGVLLNIFFLAFSSQLLFHYLGPQRLGSRQVLVLNILVGCILVSYVRSVRTDPGTVPYARVTDQVQSSGALPPAGVPEATPTRAWQRWCNKCEASKPPRAHHCKTCERFAPASLISLMTIFDSNV